MSAAASLVRDLRSRGVTLHVQDGKLHGDAPKGVLTAEDRAQLIALKAEVIAALGAEERTAGWAHALYDPFAATAPTITCPTCRSMAWRRAGSGWVCGLCHPDPMSVVSNATGESS